jgi:NAD(P)H-hydrate repair Nnr-like enzyme with NAD(P)H-hydrate dehydratase domain
MTPHVAEFSRLTRRTVDEINADPISAASKFASNYGVWLVLKGTRTIVAKPTGHIVINTTGNPGMATAGCGDVLTGVIAACLAKKEVERRYAAECGGAPYFKDITAYDTALKNFDWPQELRQYEDGGRARAEWLEDQRRDTIFFGSDYTLGVLEAVYIHGRAGDLAARARGEVSLIASDILHSLGEAFTSVTEKSYPSGFNDRYGTQVTQRKRWTPSHETLVTVSSEFLGHVRLSDNYFGPDAASNFFDMIIKAENDKN